MTVQVNAFINCIGYQSITESTSKSLLLHISVCYLQDLKVELIPTRPGLQSSTSHRLLIPKITCKTFTSRSFSVPASVLWNSIPEELKNIKDVLSFKKALKTYLFKDAFNSILC